MNPEAPTCKVKQAAVILVRCLLGAGFIYLGFTKVMQPVNFLKLIQQYEVFPGYVFVNFIAGILPWFEIFCGILLVSGFAVRGTALVLAGLLSSFTALMLYRTATIMAVKALPFWAVKFDCGCGTGEIFIHHKLAENLGLIVIALWLISLQKGKACVQARDKKNELTYNAQTNAHSGGG